MTVVVVLIEIVGALLLCAGSALVLHAVRRADVIRVPSSAASRARDEESSAFRHAA